MSSRFHKIEAWESGAIYPTYIQLEKLADQYHCPVAVFFFPEPPRLEPIQKSFRTLPDSEFVQIPRSVRMLLHRAKAMQFNLNELYKSRNPANRPIVHDLVIRSTIHPNDAAHLVRKYLNVNLEKQLSWRNPEESFEKWREILYHHGVFVFKEAFKENDYSGFCLFDKTFPLIYVNNSVPRTRQIFTLFHELAHLLFRTSGIDTRTDEYIHKLEGTGKQIEVFCNQFAAAFLVPDADFESAIQGLRITEPNIADLSHRYKVSREVILRKFLGRHLITQEFYEKKSSEWIDQVTRSGGKGDYYLNQISYLGKNYVNDVLECYYKHKITEDQMAEYFNIKTKNLVKLEDSFLRRNA